MRTRDKRRAARMFLRGYTTHGVWVKIESCITEKEAEDAIRWALRTPNWEGKVKRKKKS